MENFKTTVQSLRRRIVPSIPAAARPGIHVSSMIDACSGYLAMPFVLSPCLATLSPDMTGFLFPMQPIQPSQWSECLCSQCKVGQPRFLEVSHRSSAFQSPRDSTTASRSTSPASPPFTSCFFGNSPGSTGSPIAALVPLGCIASVTPSTCDVPHSVKVSEPALVLSKKKPVAKFECTVCNKYFMQSSNLTAHLRVHTGEKPFRCTLCPLRFSQSSNLKRHLRVHTGEKPFECPFCGKRCSRKGSLTTHIRTHTGERPFQCSTCDKRFPIASTLKIHERTHSGLKPFKCQSCDKTFPRRSELTRHLKSHTSKSSVGGAHLQLSQPCAVGQAA